MPEGMTHQEWVACPHRDDMFTMVWAGKACVGGPYEPCVRCSYFQDCATMLLDGRKG